MLLATVLLPLALAPQAAAPAQEPAPPPPPAAVQEPAAPPPAVQATDIPASPAPAPNPHVDAGLAAFKKHRFVAARDEFEKAVAADPQSAAAHFYLGYTFYKLGEPSKRMNDNKEKAKEEFAKTFTLDPTFQPVWGPKK
jgi:tetratricopeptide (TPR) repeat protein